MALWQYNFFVLPKESVSEISPGKSFKKADGLFDDSPYWKYARIHHSLFEPLQGILPLGKSWSKDLVLYGNTESNCFEVFLEGEFIESVSFRIDFRSNYETILDKLILFLMKNDMIVLDENLCIIGINEYDYRAKIEGSEQYRKYFKLADALNKKKDV